VVIGVARQHPFEASSLNCTGCLDLPNAGAVGRGRQHLPDDFQIDGIRHALDAYHARSHLMTWLAAMEPVRAALRSIVSPRLALVGEHDLEDA
jgi:hypothetical protein